MKEFLSQRGQAFVLRLVEEDDRAYDELIQRGFRAVPVTCVGERCVAGYDESALTTLLDGRKSHESSNDF